MNTKIRLTTYRPRIGNSLFVKGQACTVERYGRKCQVHHQKGSRTSRRRADKRAVGRTVRRLRTIERRLKLNRFQKRIAALDAALTGKDWETVSRAAESQSYCTTTPEDFLCMDDAYYLSDYGYSRICCDDDGRLFLSSVSRKEVKAAWDRCKELIADIERETIAIA